MQRIGVGMRYVSCMRSVGLGVRYSSSNTQPTKVDANNVDALEGLAPVSRVR